MYSCDLSFKVWEYTYEDFSIFDFYQFSIVVLVTYFHNLHDLEFHRDKQQHFHLVFLAPVQ